MLQCGLCKLLISFSTNTLISFIEKEEKTEKWLN